MAVSSFKMVCACGASQWGTMRPDIAKKVMDAFAESHAGAGCKIFGTRKEADAWKREQRRLAKASK